MSEEKEDLIEEFIDDLRSIRFWGDMILNNGRKIWKKRVDTLLDKWYKNKHRLLQRRIERK